MIEGVLAYFLEVYKAGKIGPWEITYGISSQPGLENASVLIGRMSNEPAYYTEFNGFICFW